MQLAGYCIKLLGISAFQSIQLRISYKAFGSFNAKKLYAPKGAGNQLNKCECKMCNFQVWPIPE